MTTKNEVLNYMRNLMYGGLEWIAGGTIEDYIRSATGTKASTASRRLRELAKSGMLEKREVNGYVEYKLAR